MLKKKWRSFGHWSLGPLGIIDICIKFNGNPFDLADTAIPRATALAWLKMSGCHYIFCLVNEENLYTCFYCSPENQHSVSGSPPQGPAACRHTQCWRPSPVCHPSAPKSAGRPSAGRLWFQAHRPAAGPQCLSLLRVKEHDDNTLLHLHNSSEVILY